MTQTQRSTRVRGDIVAVALATGLVAVAYVVGESLKGAGVDIFLGLPPLLAVWAPHVGPGTPFAVVVALAVVTRGPELAARLPWRRLLVLAYAASAGWTVSLALVDGWTRGVVERLSSDQEYLWDIPRVTDVPMMLRTFADHILPAPDMWVTHVGAHPPGVFLFYVGLDRIGLGGGGPSGVVTMLVGASACVAVAVTLKALDAERIARAALPFGVLFPGAVWVGVSADGMFAAVLAWGVALVAIGTAGSRIAAAAGGVLLGYCLYLSYGLVLGGLVPLAVLGATRSGRAAAWAAGGVFAVVAAFTHSGFWWFDGFERVQVIYALSVASTRPHSYFVWANLAALLLALGPAVVAGLRRFPQLSTRAVWLVAAGAAAILVADLSGLSKAEVERIWLPFGIWLVVSCAALPRPRAWLAAQAGLALAVNHLLLTVW